MNPLKYNTARKEDNSKNNRIIKPEGRIRGRTVTPVKKMNPRRLSLNISDLLKNDSIDPSQGKDTIAIFAHEPLPMPATLKKNGDRSPLSTSSPRIRTLQSDNEITIPPHRSLSSEKEKNLTEKKKGKKRMRNLFRSKEKEVKRAPVHIFFQYFTTLITRPEFRNFVIDLKKRKSQEEQEEALKVQSAWLDLLFCMEPQKRDKIFSDLMYSAISKAKEPELILREDTPARYLLASYIQKHMTNLADNIHQKIELYNASELHSKNPDEVDYDNLNCLLEKTLTLTIDFCLDLPIEIHQILYLTQKKTKEIFPDNTLTGILSLFFLQGITPLLTEVPATNHKNRLIITILLQKLANRAIFDAENMFHYNPVLERHQEHFHELITILSEKTAVPPSFDEMPVKPSKIRKSILLLMSFFCKNLEIFEKEHKESPTPHFYINAEKAFKEAGLKRRALNKTIKAWVEESRQKDPERNLVNVSRLFKNRYDTWSSRDVELWLKLNPQDPKIANFLLYHEYSGFELYKIVNEKTLIDNELILNLMKDAIKILNIEISKAPEKALARLKDKGIEAWTSWDVAVWLNALGIKEYISTVIQTKIDGNQLKKSRYSKIYSILGIKKIYHQKAIKKSLEQT